MELSVSVLSKSKENGMSKATRWTIRLSVGLVLVLSMAGWLSAQQPPAPAQPPAASSPAPPDDDITSDIALTRASIQLRRQAIITSVMDLSEKEAEAFWPLYRDYRVEMAKVGDRISKLLVQYSEQYDTLTDEQAVRLMNDWLDIEKAKTSVKSKFVPRFRKILPARVMRFFRPTITRDARACSTRSSSPSCRSRGDKGELT
jgi:hypothetical protein